MRSIASKLQIGVLALAAASVATAVPRYIGMVSAEGSFWVDSAGVSDHATVFEGSIVETTDAPATVQVGSAVRVVLDANTRAQVYADRMLLDRGRGQLDGGSNYWLEARALRITPGAAGSRAVVAIGDSGAVEVGSLSGDVLVANADGVRVANVEAGNSVELREEQGKDISILTGCVVRAGNAYLMRDEVSAVMVELRGAEMASQADKRVQVTGKVVISEKAAAPADQVVQAAQIKALETGCSTTAGFAGSGSRARVAAGPLTGGIAPGAGGAPRTLVAGERVAAGQAGTVKSVQSRRHHKPPISKGR